MKLALLRRFVLSLYVSFSKSFFVKGQSAVT